MVFLDNNNRFRKYNIELKANINSYVYFFFIVLKDVLMKIMRVKSAHLEDWSSGHSRVLCRPLYIVAEREMIQH